MKSLILLFFFELIFVLGSECQTCPNHHIQVITQSQACYGDHNGSIFVLPDTGHCAVCDLNGFYISKFIILDSSGEEVQGNDYLLAGTYNLIAIMSCNSEANGSQITIDSINEFVTLAQPPFPYPVFTKVTDTSQICSGGEFTGYVGAPDFVVYDVDHGELCAYLNLQHKVNGVIQPILDVPVSGDTGYFDVRNCVAGQYRFISGAYTTLRMDTTPWITMDVCGTPTSGFGTKSRTTSSAIVVWDPWPCAERFKVRYRKENEGAWKTTSVINAFTFGAARLNGLDPGTTYQWQVQSLCSYDPDVASPFSSMQTFTTLKSQEKDQAAALNYSTEKMLVFPNPASNQITLECSAPEGIATISIYDALGRDVLNMKWNTDEGKTNIDVNRLKSGMYEVIVHNDSYTGTGTFIRQ